MQRMAKGLAGFSCLSGTAAALLLAFFLSFPAQANAQRREPVSQRPPKPENALLNFFGKKFDIGGVYAKTPDVRNAFAVYDVSDTSAAANTPEPLDKTNSVAAPDKPLPVNSSQEQSGRKLEYRTNNPEDTPILPPDETPSVRVEPDAPGSIKGLVTALRDGDKKLAGEYADQFVRMQQNFFFELREIVDEIGNALVRQGQIDEDDWVGAKQFLDYEMAKTRRELGEVIKPTHDVAMTRIEADPKNQAEIFYFFTLNCSWCRYMAPDLERLWQMVKDDPNVRLTALTLGPTPEDWLREYRNYTGLTVPIADGGDLAKTLGVAFVPAVVVISPNGAKAYLKTGQQSFDRLYEFVRTVQGLPAVVDEKFQLLASTPIGEAEKAKSRGALKNIQLAGSNAAKSGRQRIREHKVRIEKF